MNESLEVIVEVIVIVSFVATVVNYTVIKPLKISIGNPSLKKSGGISHLIFISF